MVKALQAGDVKKNSVLLMMALFSVLVLNACNKPDHNTEKTLPIKMDDSVVALVGDRKISVTDFKANMIKRSGGATAHFESDDNKRRLLDEMINKEVQIISAKKAGYDNDPDIIKTIEKLMVNKLREEKLKLILKDIAISHEEINDYYLANSDKYTTPALSRIAIIKLSVYDTASEQKKKNIKEKAEYVLKLSNTLPKTIKGFGSLAVKYSEHQASRYIGGDIGWIDLKKTMNRLDKGVLESMNTLNMNVNDSSLIKGSDGYYLVKVIDRKSQQQQALKKVERGIQHILLRQKRTTAESNWLLSLQDNVQPIKINQSILGSITPPASTKPVRSKQNPPKLPKQ